MTKAIVVTARIDEELSTRLDQLASAMERTRAWLIGKAIERYVADELEQTSSIEKGDADFREGRVITQDEMLAWVDSLERPAAAAA